MRRCWQVRTFRGGDFEVFNGNAYPGLNLQIGRRNVEAGGRIETFVNQMLRGVVGIKGSFSDAWSYNVHAQRGTTEIHDSLDNYLGNSQLEQALNVLPGINGPVCGGAVGNPNNPLVGSGTAFTANPKCVPWDIWVPGAVSSASLASMYVPLLVSGTVTQRARQLSAPGARSGYRRALRAAVRHRRWIGRSVRRCDAGRFARSL